MVFTYREDKEINLEALRNLYDDNGWSLYTRDMESLKRGINNSLYVKTVWNGEELVGLIRAVGDGEAILYVQDILILRAYHRQGLGTKLLKDVLDRYKHVRQKALLTDTTEKTDAFYRSLGFVEPNEQECRAFVRLDLDTIK